MQISIRHRGFRQAEAMPRAMTSSALSVSAIRRRAPRGSASATSLASVPQRSVAADRRGTGSRPARSDTARCRAASSMMRSNTSITGPTCDDEPGLLEHLARARLLAASRRARRRRPAGSTRPSSGSCARFTSTICPSTSDDRADADDRTSDTRCDHAPAFNPRLQLASLRRRSAPITLTTTRFFRWPSNSA